MDNKLKNAVKDHLRYCSIIAMALSASLLSINALAQDQPTRLLEDVQFLPLPDNGVQITLSLSESAPKPIAFTVAQPARLSLDLPETGLGQVERYTPIEVGNTRGVATAEGGDRSRVVVELTQLVPYTINVQGNDVILRLGGEALPDSPLVESANIPPKPTSAAEAGLSVPSKRTADSPAAGQARITNVDFRRSERGAGQVIVELSNPRTPVSVQAERGKVVAKFANTFLPESMQRRLDVLDFATPAKFIDARQVGDDTVVTITPIEGALFEQLAYQTGQLFTVELQPLTEAEVEAKRKKEPKYEGERISLNFQNVDIRALLQIIADVADVNMVISDSVSGTIALRLQNVPWDQALDIILTTKGLGMRQEGNVIQVAPLAEIAAREQAELEAQQVQVEAAPLTSEIVQINYARAGDVAALLQSGDTSLLSGRGRVSIDERTNTLIITETREKLEEIRSLIDRLDIPVRQVLIESRIVVANTDFLRSLGVNFSAIDPTTTQGTGAAGSVGPGAIPGSGFNIGLPTAGPAGVFSFGILADDFNIDLELSALQAEDRGEVISSPRVITANGKEAVIEQGTEIPFQEASSSGATAVSFKEAVLSLRVTPQITPDERVIMDLEVTQDAVGENVPSGIGGGLIPSIDTRSVTTQVLVNNGETVVLGGIYQQDKSNTVTKVPVLGDIPLIGALFRTRTLEDDKTELLIFVTPRMLRESLDIR